MASTVKSFGESYNYYLNQIKLLMDALGNVATRTGEALFSGGNDDLKSRFGSLMRDTLKTETGDLKGDAGDVVLIGSLDEPEAPEEAAGEAEAMPEEVGEAAEAAEETP